MTYDPDLYGPPEYEPPDDEAQRTADAFADAVWDAANDLDPGQEQVRAAWLAYLRGEYDRG